MKTTQQNQAELKNATGEIELARLRLATAECKLAAARKQARLARQRRKSAKLAARQAKKRFRLAKERVAAAKLALAKLEARLAQRRRAPVRAIPHKPAVKEVSEVPRRKRPAQLAAVRPRKVLKIPVPRRAEARPTAGPVAKKAKIVSTLPGDL